MSLPHDTTKKVSEYKQVKYMHTCTVDVQVLHQLEKHSEQTASFKHSAKDNTKLFSPL